MEHNVANAIADADFDSLEVLNRYVPPSFDEALELYSLRATDREGWENRNAIENASWLINTLQERVHQEQTFSAQLVQMMRRRDDHDF